MMRGLFLALNHGSGAGRTGAGGLLGAKRRLAVGAGATADGRVVSRLFIQLLERFPIGILPRRETIRTATMNDRSCS